MNRKVIIYGSVAAVVLVACVAALLVNLFKTDDVSYSVNGPASESIYAAVPSDAVMVFKSNSLDRLMQSMQGNGLLERFFSKKNDAIFDFLDGMRAAGHVFADSPVVFSMHYASKNRLSVLVSIFTGNENADLESLLKNTCPASSVERTKKGIYSVGGNLFAKKEGRFVLISDYRIVLESSLQHMENHASILDVKEASMLLKQNSTFDNVLIINHQQAGKIFSGISSAQALKHSDFISDFTTWSSFVLDIDETVISGSGNLLNMKGKGNFAYILENSAPSSPDLYAILPYNTAAVVRISISDIKAYMDNYETFIKLYDDINDYRWIQTILAKEHDLSPREWIESVNPSEVAIAGISAGDHVEWIAVLRVKRNPDIGAIISKTMSRDNEIEIRPFEYRGYMGSVFGNIFRLADESYSIDYKDWKILGSRQVLESFVNGTYSAFSLKDYVSDTRLSAYMSSPSTMSCVMNLNGMEKDVVSFFSDTYAPCADSVISAMNYQFLALNFNGSGSGVSTDLCLLAENMDKLPSPDLEEGEMLPLGDTVVTNKKGPFAVRNFITGKTNYLNQLDNGKLQLIDDKRRSVWTIDFKSGIAGMVEQIDKYKNGKLQMLFCSGDMLYLLDRLGRFVSGYPVKLPKKVVLGPSVYDFRGDKDYSFIVLNADNSLSLYNADGTPYKGWTDIKVKEKVTQLPELMKAGKDYYWIVRSSSRAYLYNLYGKRIDKDDKKRIIARDSEFKAISSSSISVECMDGKVYKLNLKNGKISR